MQSAFLAALPDVRGFQRVTQSLAALDAILSPEWEYRYHSFDAAWNAGAMMASMRDGSGDHWHAVITADGVALHGLAHEAGTFEAGRPKAWVFGALPAAFHSCLLHEPAFETSNSTYCLWRCHGDATWSRGTDDDVDDGMIEHLSILIGGPRGYANWASDYFETEVDVDDVTSVFEHRPISAELARRLNPEVDVAALRDDLRGIGYPI